MHVKKTFSYMQFKVANKMNVDTCKSIDIDKDMTSIGSVLWLNLKVICFSDVF